MTSSGFALQGNFGLPKDFVAYRAPTRQSVKEGVRIAVFYGSIPPVEGETARPARPVALCLRDDAGQLHSIRTLACYPSEEYECHYVFNFLGIDVVGVQYEVSEAVTLSPELFRERRGQIDIGLYETDGGEVTDTEPICSQTLYYRKAAFGRVCLSNVPFS